MPRKRSLHFWQPFSLYGLLLWSFPGTGFGASGAPTLPESSPDPALTAERAYRRWDLDDLQFSPAGERLAFTLTGPREGIRMDQDIWIFHLGNSTLRQLTFSEAGEHHPRWSPDGKQLAFLSDRSGTPQIYILSMAGGEGRPLTQSQTPVESFQWSPDGRQIAFSAQEPAPSQDDKSLASGVRIVGLSFYSDLKGRRQTRSEERGGQLWTVDVANGETRQLTRGDWRLAHPYWNPNVSWAPEGDRIYASGTTEPVPEKLDNRIYSIQLVSGEMKEVARPPGGFGQLKLSPDGKVLAYLGPREDAFEYDDLYVLPLSGSPVRNLTAVPVDRRLLAYEWLSDSSLMVLASDGFQSAFFRCHLDGSVQKLPRYEAPPSGHFTYSMPFAASGDSLAFVGEKTDVAPELWVSVKEKAPRKVSHFNREWDTIPVLPLEIVRYPSFDGTEIEAGLLKPHGYRDGTRVPLVANVHGGPSSKFSDRFDIRQQLLASNGMAVLIPNIRGSTGYGYRFLTMNRQDWGGGDYRDVMAGVDFLVSQGLADADRLGIGGWSYGGYMAAWAVTQTRRFRAAVAGAPMTNLVSEYGTEARWSHYYHTWYSGTPYQNIDFFVSRSPVTHVSQVRTPILLMVGEQDDNTPLGQALEFYRGLKLNDVETDLVIYGDSGHFPTDDRQRIDVYERFVDWFVTHLKP